MLTASLLPAFAFGRYVARSWFGALLGGLIGLLGTATIMSMMLSPSVDQLNVVGAAMSDLVQKDGLLAAVSPILAVGASLFGYSRKQRRLGTRGGSRAA